MLSKPAMREAYNLQLEQALQDEDDDFSGAWEPSICSWSYKDDTLQTIFSYHG